MNSQTLSGLLAAILLVFSSSPCDSTVRDSGHQSPRDTNSNEDFGERTTLKPEDLQFAIASRYIGHVNSSLGKPPTTTTKPGRPSGASSQIYFPEMNMTMGPGPRITDPRNILNPNRKSKVPLDILKRLSHESDVIKVFEKYVSNVQFKVVDGQKYLFNADGTPIQAELGGPTGVTTEKTKVTTKPIIGGFSLNDRNMINRPQAQANAERIASPQGGERVTKAALCEPELQTVEVPKPSDPNIIQFPRCVRLQRCGGCCGSDLLTCEVLKEKQTEVQVQKFSYNDESAKLEFTGTEIYKLPSHEECRCNCRVKAGDCTERHAYSSEDCLCTCKNRGEQEVCLRQSHKLWDPNLCQCICREIKACSSGFSFNLETCECAVSPDPKAPSKEKGSRNPNQRNRRSRHSKRGLKQN